jgi:hypothetical protein
MTVAEMIVKLQGLSPELPVYLVDSSTSHGRHITPEEVKGFIAVVNFHGSPPHEALLLCNADVRMDIENDLGSKT